MSYLSKKTLSDANVVVCYFCGGSPPKVESHQINRKGSARISMKKDQGRVPKKITKYAKPSFPGGV